MDKKTKVVILGLIKRDDKFLISQRYDTAVPEAHLKWDLPGGTNEFGESLVETLKREILEETGIHVEVLDMFPNCSSRLWDHEEYKMHTLVFCFNCRYVSGEPHLNDPKINDLRWVTRDEFSQYEFLSTAQDYINML